MIENDHQLEVSYRKLAKLRGMLDRLRSEYAEQDKVEFFSRGHYRMIAQIESEIEAYLKQREPAEPVTS